MASHVEVIATDLRRAKVQVFPGTTLSQVLEKACKTLKLSRDDYLLRHKNKQLDLLLPFRTSGLGPGAKLELIVRSSSPSVVSVALQFAVPEPGVPNDRLTDKFPSNFTLWKVLRQFESGGTIAGRNLNITARGIAQTQGSAQSGSGQLYYETPVINIMGRDLSSFTDLQKSLSQVGITSGSVLLRLSFKRTETTLYDAMKEISQYFDRPEEDESGDSKAGNSEPQTTNEPENALPDGLNTADPVETTGPHAAVSEATSEATPETPDIPMEPTPSDGNHQTAETNPKPLPDQLQPVSVFSAPTSSTPAAALVEVADSVFTPTIAHAQLYQARLQIISQNKRLKSDAELEADAAAAAAKVAAIKSVHIRVRFPDNTSAQWEFGPDATGATLFGAVRGVMDRAGEPFKLVLPGSTSAIRDADGPKDGLIRGYGLKGGVLLNLHWEDGASAAARTGPFLRASFASRAQEVKVPDVPADAETEAEVGRPIKAQRPAEGSGEGGGGGKKLPKWLKLPGKK